MRKSVRCDLCSLSLVLTYLQSSGVERPLRKRAILRVDLSPANLARFIICAREDVRVNEVCYPKMEITCTKCENTWSSVGFPAQFGAHRNHERWSLFGELLMFRQQCKKCNIPEWPKCDQTVIDHILHTVWVRVQARGGSGPRKELDEKKTHLRNLCEGCDVQVCRFAPKEDGGAPPGHSRGRRVR